MVGLGSVWCVLIVGFILRYSCNIAIGLTGTVVPRLPPHPSDHERELRIEWVGRSRYLCVYVIIYIYYI